MSEFLAGNKVCKLGSPFLGGGFSEITLPTRERFEPRIFSSIVDFRDGGECAQLNALVSVIILSISVSMEEACTGGEVGGGRGVEIHGRGSGLCVGVGEMVVEFEGRWRVNVEDLVWVLGVEGWWQ